MKLKLSSTIAFGAALIAGIFVGSTTLGVASEAKKLLSSEIAASTIPAPQSQPGILNKPYLIAASPQLNNLLYNFTYRVTSIARYYVVTSPDYDAAYSQGWTEFYNIIEPNSLQPPRWSLTAGWIYTANLKGGGSSNLREYGASLPLRPTIDLFNHNTPPLNGQPFSQVREVKFPYN
ncbi:MAG: hypothetical protein SVX43_11955 [Cyanobacteriota bacterium]|nr:hypothetical protein [Cyanobacteriota bacterium]